MGETKSSWSAEVRRYVIDDALVTVGCVLFALIVLLLLRSEQKAVYDLGSFVTNLTVMILLTGIPAFVWSFVRHKPVSPLRHCVDWPTQSLSSPRFVGAIPSFLAFSTLLPAFGAIKSAIPRFVPYSYDDRLLRLDNLLHGGPAWRLLEALFAMPKLIFAISIAYQLWILLIFVGLPLMIFGIKDRVLRQQSLIAILLCWVLLGTVLAILLASVGPCFLEVFTGRTDFLPLMDKLRDINRDHPIIALQVQDQLIAWKRSGDTGLGSGISAMPSMHVSIACVFALLAWKLSRQAGVLMSAFLVAIMVGSVVLAYHYAVDGYVSLALTPLIWMASGLAGRHWVAANDNWHISKVVNY